MLGQLQDAGNTTTLAHYLKLLESAFLISGLEQFSRGTIRQKGSSPKLILWNNALVNALSVRSYEEAILDRPGGGGWSKMASEPIYWQPCRNLERLCHIGVRVIMKSILLLHMARRSGVSR